MTHKQLVHVGLRASWVGALDQFPQLERVQLMMRRILSQMLQQMLLVAIATIARDAKHQVVPRLALAAAALRIHSHLLAASIHSPQSLSLLLAHRVAPNHLFLPAVRSKLFYHEASSSGQMTILREMNRFPAKWTAMRVERRHGVSESAFRWNVVAVGGDVERIGRGNGGRSGGFGGVGACFRLLLAFDGADVFVGGVADVLAETAADDADGTGDGSCGCVFGEADNGCVG